MSSTLLSEFVVLFFATNSRQPPSIKKEQGKAWVRPGAMAQPMASSVDIGWHDGKPRVVSQDVREYMQGSARAHRPQAAAAHAPAGRLPRPRSKNAPTPAKTVDYSRVPRNEVDAFTLRTPQDGRPTHGRGAAELVLDNAESLRQLEYLAHTSSAAGASARATAADLRQSATRGGDERGGVGRGGVAGCKGAVAARGASSLRHSSSTALPRATREKRSKGGAAMACSLMLLALAVQPAVSQMESGPVTPDSVFEAHDTLTRRAADEAVAECARGSHRTSGGVTSAGSAGCRYPRRAHAVEEGDELGKLLAPLYPWEFLLASEGGTWGRSPRHISRQDHRYFDAFRLYGDEQIHELLKNCRAVSDSRSNSTQMRHLEDVKLVKGRRDARTVAGPQPAPEGADAPLPADVSWMEVLGYYEEGYSVVVGHVDVRSRRIAAFVAGLEEQTGIPMRAHLQWTPPFTDAGGEHTGQLHEPPLDAWGAARGKQTGGAAAASGYERARLLEAPAREGVGDVFLLQLSGRQIIHAYEGRGVPAVQGAAAAGGGDASGLAQEQGQQGGAAVHDGPQEGAQGGGGVVEERGEKVEGMVVGEEVDERDMFTTLLRPGDTLYIPRGWTYESTTNTSFLESPSAHVALMAHVGAVSWQTVVHAAIKVVVEEEEASHPHFLGQRIPLLEQAAASLSHLFGGGQEAGEGRDRDDDERGRGGPAARAHLLDSVPAEIAAVWPCAGATLSLQDVLHWLVSALALSEVLPLPPQPTRSLAPAHALVRACARANDRACVRTHLHIHTHTHTHSKQENARAHGHTGTRNTGR